MANPLCRQPKRVTWIMKPFIHSCMHAYGLLSSLYPGLPSYLSFLGSQNNCTHVFHSFIRFFHSLIHSDSYLPFSPFSFSCNNATISYHLLIPSSWNNCIFSTLKRTLPPISLIMHNQVYTETAAIHLVYRSKTKFNSNSNSIGL